VGASLELAEKMVLESVESELHGDLPLPGQLVVAKEMNQCDCIPIDVRDVSHGGQWELLSCETVRIDRFTQAMRATYRYSGPAVSQ